MDKAKRQLWKFIGASAGLHFVISGLLFFLPLKLFQPHQSASVIQVSLVDAVETRPVSTKLRQRMETPLKMSGDLPVHEAPIMKGPEESAGDEAPSTLEEVREEIVQQPSSPGSDAFPVAEGFGKPATGNSSHPEELNRFLQDVRSRLEQAKRYPWLARIQGQEGTARVQFMINASGEIQEIRLLESSRSKILDEEAVTMVKRVGRFSRLPISWNEDVKIQVPLVFQLNSP